MMTDVAGGLRSRLIMDSLYHAVHDGLTALGWFDPGRQHQPLRFEPMPVNSLIEIPLNTVALSDENLTEVEMELGSNAVETSQTYYLDIYAESDVLGKHFINDIRDFLGGRLPAIGRVDSSIEVYDYRMATPVVLFGVQVDNIIIDRAHDFPKPWQQHWYSCSFIIRDAYGS